MDKHAIIRLKNQGYSNRETSKILKINRKTVAKYWNEYKDNVKSLDNPNIDRALVQEKIAKTPSYDSSNRKKVKYTKEVDEQRGHRSHARGEEPLLERRQGHH